MPRNCAKNSAQGKDPDASYLGDKNVTQTKKPPKPAAFPCCERCVRAGIPGPGGTVGRYLTPITSISIFSSGMARELTPIMVTQGAGPPKKPASGLAASALFSAVSPTT